MSNTYTETTTSSTTSSNTNSIYGTYATSGYEAYSIHREVLRPSIIIDEVPYLDFLTFQKSFFPEIKKKITNWKKEIEE